MFAYVMRRLILLPITLFFILLVNFVIINLAPGDPTTVTEITPQGGASRREDRAVAFGSDDRYLQFREHYGLTLPIMFNTWPWVSEKEVKENLWKLTYRKESPSDSTEMNVKKYDKLRILFGDQSRYLMPKILNVIEDPKESIEMRLMASRFFVRGGTRQAILGPNLNKEQKAYNKKIAKDNQLLSTLLLTPDDKDMEPKAKQMREWYEDNKNYYQFAPTYAEEAKIFFVDTRFVRYMSRVVTLDFGTMRNDPNKTVLMEVTKRFKYSPTLAYFYYFLRYHPRAGIWPHDLLLF